MFGAGVYGSSGPQALGFGGVWGLEGFSVLGLVGFKKQGVWGLGLFWGLGEAVAKKISVSLAWRLCLHFWKTSRVSA